jgi:hypothetical protein
MPHFQGHLEPTQNSYDWIVGADHRFVNATIEAIGKSINAYAAERGRPAPPPLGG